MPIHFCQLLEKAVERNDIVAVKDLCDAYQMISDIAFQAAESAGLPAIFLSPEQHNNLLLAAKDKSQILILLQQIKIEPPAELPGLADAKDQKVQTILNLEKLFQRCKNKKNWRDLNKLWDARCKINTVLSQYFSNENLIAIQEINFYFPYVLDKEKLKSLISQLLEAWCADDSKYSYEYIGAVLYKVIDSEMLDPKCMISDLNRIIQKQNTEKNAILAEVIATLESWDAQRIVAKWNATATQSQSPYAENATKAIHALNVRFEFVQAFFKEEKYKLVVKELNDDMKALPSEYKQYDEWKSLAQRAQMLDKIVVDKSVQTDAKAAVYNSPLSGLVPILVKLHDGAAQQTEMAAFTAELRLTEHCQTTSAGSTPPDPSISKFAVACVAAAPGGPG